MRRGGCGVTSWNVVVYDVVRRLGARSDGFPTLARSADLEERADVRKRN